MGKTSAGIRSDMVEALGLDIVGPDNSHAFSHELLPDPPSKWYLTGFLVPSGAPAEQRFDLTSDEQMDNGATDAGGFDDTSQPDKAASKSYLPSSMGLTVLVGPDEQTLQATVQWGDYAWEGDGEKDPEPETQPEEHTPSEVEEPKAVYGGGPTAVIRGYRRIPREEKFAIPLPKTKSKPLKIGVPNSGGLIFVVTVRDVSVNNHASVRLPSGTRAVSVFVVNNRPSLTQGIYKSYAFQVTLLLNSNEPFIPRPDLRIAGNGLLTDEWDERVADLQYRDTVEYAVGHSVSATWKINNNQCFEVMSTWIPTAEVERIEPAKMSEVELRMDALAGLVDAEEAKTKLLPLVTQYHNWIDIQIKKLSGLDPTRIQTGEDLLKEARFAADRIERGINDLADPQVFKAFCIANSAMAKAARQRFAINSGKKPEEVSAPVWHPFQLAFLLMTIRGIHNPLNGDREIVDLLFFPTGGGKTEAYLGLAAFTLVLRRLRNPGIRSAGMSVLMRYTLRLLTLDQLSRAAALMCALELEREKDKSLGDWPFEIGLWVGSAATPNRMGKRGYTGPGKDDTAYKKTKDFKQNSKNNPAPIPIENCPWCGTKFDRDSFRLTPNEKEPLNLIVSCSNYTCAFSGNRSLPIVAVDEPIYRRLPAFIIATVDKFASLPWTAATGALFGLVDRFDNHGFYGPATSGVGQQLGGKLPPPDLIIQDELHLISGPLGTIAGIYETTIDILSTREIEGKSYRPKIIASTATVRRAVPQIQALFDRKQVAVFPSPGPDRRDSFFARAVTSNEIPARLYVGVAAQGRSLKVVMLRTMLAILGAGQTIYDAEGGKRNTANPVDPYMTLLGYFNSLRELGGSRRIVEDEVHSRLALYSRRKIRYTLDKMFSNRKIQHDILELTSRVSTNDVAAAKERLSHAFHEDDHVDVALATNMISVGLDITRLGLMVVLGQPKTSAEYIQATSRVGRAAQRPGLVITLFNVHKPRDRSHYERFTTFHTSFYRSVEATSVTPFSPRALDKALVGALVAAVRHGMPEMTPPSGATEILRLRAMLDSICDRFARRAHDHDVSLDADRKKALEDNVRSRCRSLLDAWLKVAVNLQQTNTALQYQRWEGGNGASLLFDMLDPEAQKKAWGETFRANRSMRDVEQNVELKVKILNDWADKR